MKPRPKLLPKEERCSVPSHIYYTGKNRPRRTKHFPEGCPECWVIYRKRHGPEPVTPEVIAEEALRDLSNQEQYISKLLLDKDNQRTEIARLNEQIKSFLANRTVHTQDFYEDEAKIGICGDTQIGSLYSRLDLLEATYDVFEEEGITQVYHTGDMCDGENMYRGHVYEIYAHGADAQVQEVVDRYPRRKGITTNFITGNHDLSYWKNAGVDIGKRIAALRPDMRYLGKEIADVYIQHNGKRVLLQVVHPGKGTAYALSYHPQKYIEALSGGQKPHIVLMGHYHKGEFIPNYRNVNLIQTKCLQSQTPFMKRKNIAAHLGFWILKFSINPARLASRFGATSFVFFEKEERTDDTGTEKTTG